MNNRPAVTAVLFYLSVAVFSQTVTITGTVIDSSSQAGIPGARVSVTAYPDVTTETSLDGTFHLVNNPVPAFDWARGGYAARVSMTRAGLSLTVPGLSGDIAVDVYNTAGGRVFQGIARLSRHGSCIVPAARFPVGLYHIAVYAGGTPLRFTVTSLSAVPSIPALAAHHSLSRNAGSYTLEIVASGYTTKHVPIPSLEYDADTIRLHPMLPQAGNPDGQCPIPPEAAALDASNPDHVVGEGTPESCTGESFIGAVALGGTITFNCGSDPVIITLNQPAKIFNDAAPDVVIDGGGKVTLSGGNTTRILYMNTCDPDQHWSTGHCDNQDHPRLTVQNLTFINGNAKNESVYEGGGAMWVRGGRLRIVNCRFFNNQCDSLGPDLGGGAVRVLDQYNSQPVYVVNSTFGGGPGLGNKGSNGGAISSIGVSWTIVNSLFSYNRAIGYRGNPPENGTGGGGSGGAIYNDGNTMTLSICGSLLEHNAVKVYGAAIFFVTNDRTGDLRIVDSVIRDNTTEDAYGWHILPGIAMHEDTQREIVNSIIE